uniref:Uncharacterized protein n=1 Tax=Arundo donax TaxID=35708 RepID=A0A0A9GX84_ARUDO
MPCQYAQLNCRFRNKYISTADLQVPINCSSCQRSSPIGASLQCCVDQWPSLCVLRFKP